MGGEGSSVPVPDWMRQTPVRRKERGPSVLSTSRWPSLAIVVSAVVANPIVMAVEPIDAPMTVLVTSIVLAVVVLKYRGQVSAEHKVVTVAAAVLALALMALYVPPIMEDVEIHTKIEGLTADVGYFACVTFSMGLICMAFILREPKAIPWMWKAAVLAVLAVIDLYVWVIPDAVPALVPFAHGAVGLMGLFTIIIPLAVLAYSRSYHSLPSDAWQ